MMVPPWQLAAVAALVPAAALLLGLLLAGVVLRARVALRARTRVLGVMPGAGVERVIWVALRELVGRRLLPDWRVVVYVADGSSPDAIRARVVRRFGVQVPANTEFIHLRSLRLQGLGHGAGLLRQALGSLLVVAEATWRAPPTILLDASGCAYGYPLAKALGVRKVRCSHHRRAAARTFPRQVPLAAISPLFSALMRQSTPAHACRGTVRARPPRAHLWGSLAPRHAQLVAYPVPPPPQYYGWFDPTGWAWPQTPRECPVWPVVCEGPPP